MNDRGECTSTTSTFYSFPGGGVSYSDSSDAWDAAAARGRLYQPPFTFVYSYNTCSPTLSVPSQIYSIDPNWATCTNGIVAFYDPPYALTSHDGLVAFSATRDQVGGQPSTTAAKAGQLPLPATATLTDPGPATAVTTSDPVPEPQKPPPSDSSTRVPGSSTIAVNVGSHAHSSSQTVKHGDAPIMISGDVYSSLTAFDSVQTLAPDSTSILTNGITNPTKPAYEVSLPALIIGSSTIAAEANSQYIIGSQTLVRGGNTLTILADPLAIGSSGHDSVVNSVTPILISAGPSILTVGSYTYAYTINSASDLAPTLQTLVPGAMITIDGDAHSLAASATAVIVVSKTRTYTQGLGGLIANGFGITLVPSGTTTSEMNDLGTAFIGIGSILKKGLWVTGSVVACSVVVVTMIL